MRLLVAIIGLTSFCIYLVFRGVAGTPSIYPVDATAATRRGCWVAAVALRAEVPLPSPPLRHNEQYGAARRVPGARGNVKIPSFLAAVPLAKRDDARPLELALHARPIRTVALNSSTVGQRSTPPRAAFPGSPWRTKAGWRRRRRSWEAANH